MGLIVAFCGGCSVVALRAESDRGAPAVEIPATAYTLVAALLTPLVLAQPLRRRRRPNRRSNGRPNPAEPQSSTTSVSQLWAEGTCSPSKA